MLGGSLARTGDGGPGVKAIWIGLQRVMDCVFGVQFIFVTRKGETNEMARTVSERPEPNEQDGQEADSDIRYLQTDSIVFQGSLTPDDEDYVRLDVAAGDTIQVRVLGMPGSSYAKVLGLQYQVGEIMWHRVVNVAYGTGVPSPLEFVAPNTQTYFVGVFQEGPGTMPYSVAIDVRSNFNALEYIASYPDLMAAFGANPEAGQQHFLAAGGREGRKANFNAAEYIASYGDLTDAFGADINAGAKHYIENGVREGRSVTFIGEEYIASYGDLIQAFKDDARAGASHYLQQGRTEGRQVSFDGLEYIASYNDLIRAFGTDARAGSIHYIQRGKLAEGRSVSFDGLEYIASYDDLISAFGPNRDLGSIHYIQHGKLAEGRGVSFNGLEYIASYDDLISAFGPNRDLGSIHYIQRGNVAEGRKVSFDAASYLWQYADLRAAFGTDFDAAAEHYIRFGRGEGRTREATLRMGTDSPESLSGGNGADKLDGLGGNDTLVGRAGDDVLVGGQGSDWMAGDAGADLYILGGGVDRISGFNRSEGDKIALDNSAFPALGTEGALRSQLWVGKEALSPDHFLVYDPIHLVFDPFSGGYAFPEQRLYYDSDGSGPNVPIHLATFEGDPLGLQSTDFLVV